MSVTLIDANATPGGVCLHRGCIPSKALLHVAKLIGEAEEATAWGLEFAKPKIDVNQLRSWKESVVEKLSGGVLQLCKQRKVKHIPGVATFRDSQSLELAPLPGAKEKPGGVLRFKHAIIASGSRPAVPKIFQLDSPRVMDSTGALQLADYPRPAAYRPVAAISVWSLAPCTRGWARWSRSSSSPMACCRASIATWCGRCNGS